jgi:hypothetical protein
VGYPVVPNLRRSMTEMLLADITSELAAPRVHTFNMVFQHILCLVGFVAVLIMAREVSQACVHHHMDGHEGFLFEVTTTFWTFVNALFSYCLQVALPFGLIFRD